MNSRNRKLRVLHVISAPAAGGAEIYVRDLALELAKRGVEVYVAFVADGPTKAEADGFAKQYLQSLEDAGVRYFFLGRISRVCPPVGIIRISRLVREYEIDIYHAHLAYGLLFGAALKVKRVYTHHNIRMRIRKWLFRIIAPRSVELVGISGACSVALVTHSGRAVRTIYNGVPRERVQSFVRLASDAPEIVDCVAVGRISPQKNYGLLLRSLSHLPDNELSSIRLRIVGDGDTDDVAKLKAIIDELGLSGTVELLGQRNDVAEILADSHLFVMSSLFEGFPIALLEATLSGLPSIVTEVGGCAEITGNSDCGIVVQPNNAKALAKAISKLAGDAVLREKLSRNAIAGSEQFSIDRAAAGHIELYSGI